MRKENTALFNERLEACKKTHKNFYVYLDEYVGSVNHKMRILCPDHGVFEQRLGNHLNGSQCPECAKVARASKKSLSKDLFVERAVGIHGFKYSYEKVILTKCNKKVVVTCPKHGDFLITPSHHMSGVGCKYCGYEKTSNSNRSTLEDFVKRAIEVHGDRYCYDNSVYTNRNSKVEIVCKAHGSFYQLPYHHLQGCGCPKCNKPLDKNYENWFKEMWLYLLELEVKDHKILKVGITSNISARVKILSKELEKHGPSSVKVIASKKAQTKSVVLAESSIHEDPNLGKIFVGVKFGGYTECYPYKYKDTLIGMVTSLDDS